jgi:hypothetical protein
MIVRLCFCFDGWMARIIVLAVEGAMAGGALAPAANLTIAAATAICQSNTRCYGWTASVAFSPAVCGAAAAEWQGPGEDEDEEEEAVVLRDVLFKDAWGARRVTKNEKYTSWVLLHHEQ